MPAVVTIDTSLPHWAKSSRSKARSSSANCPAPRPAQRLPTIHCTERWRRRRECSVVRGSPAGSGALALLPPWHPGFRRRELCRKLRRQGGRRKALCFPFAAHARAWLRGTSLDHRAIVSTRSPRRVHPDPSGGQIRDEAPAGHRRRGSHLSGQADRAGSRRGGQGPAPAAGAKPEFRKHFTLEAKLLAA